MIIGGFGIIVNDLALALFHLLFKGAFYSILEVVCSFLVSNAVNFVLNQLITYPEYKPTTTFEWIKRGFTVQVTSASALLVTTIISLLLTNILHISTFITNPIGLCCSFIYKYFVSDRFVYRPRPGKQHKKPVVIDPMMPPIGDEVLPPVAEHDVKSV